MKRNFFFGILITTTFFISTGWSAEPTTKLDFNALFNSAAKNINAKNFDAARHSLEEALKIQPDNNSVKLNLAIIAFQKDEIGLAYGLVRSILESDPQSEKARQFFRYLNEKKAPRVQSQVSSTIEDLHNSVLNRFNYNSLMLMFAASLLISGALWLIYVKKRKILLEQQEVPPGFPWIQVFASAILVTFASLVFLKAWDQSITRSTVIKDDATVLTAPDDNDGIEIYRLYQGNEVYVLDFKDKYVKIKVPGSLSGWVKKDQLYFY